jgi:hypothetical protein
MHPEYMKLYPGAETLDDWLSRYPGLILSSARVIENVLEVCLEVNEKRLVVRIGEGKDCFRHYKKLDKFAVWYSDDGAIDSAIPGLVDDFLELLGCESSASSQESAEAPNEEPETLFVDRSLFPSSEMLKAFFENREITYLGEELGAQELFLWVREGHGRVRLFIMPRKTRGNAYIRSKNYKLGYSGKLNDLTLFGDLVRYLNRVE